MLERKLELCKFRRGQLGSDISELVGKAAKTMALRAHQKGLELLCHFAPDVPAVVVADPDRLRQVLVNLAGNAIKFTARGEVLISVAVESRVGAALTLHFSVADTGIGIPAGKHKSIFEAFRQVDTSSTRRFEGAGLGLYLSRKLATLLGAELTFTSEFGVGSIFMLAVPEN